MKMNWSLNDMMIRKYTDELKTTITGEKCQNWGSNEVHYEGNVFNIFRPKIIIDNNREYTWEEINNHKHSSYIKDMIKDGLFKYNPTSKKWHTHNSCRNPNNARYGSWCYTTNPKVRWEYCVKPSYNVQMRKYVLIFLFFFIIFLAYYMVKLIFRFELFTQFMARLTGTKFEQGAEGQGNSTNTASTAPPQT